MSTNQNQALADALYFLLQSPNVSDANMESANLVDTTHQIAKALINVSNRLGTAQAGLNGLEYIGICIREGLHEIATAIAERA